MDARSDEATDRRSVGRRNCISALIIASARTAFISGLAPQEVRPTRQSPEKVFSHLRKLLLDRSILGQPRGLQISSNGINEF